MSINHTGLDNLGNTCYINTMLQMLMAVPDLNSYFLDDEFIEDINMCIKLKMINNQGQITHNFLLTRLYSTMIYHLQKKTDIEIRAFDTGVSEIVKYKGNNEFPRTYCGGTSFTAAVNYFNESKYQSCIIFTDGHAEVPPKCNKRLLWVISSNGTEHSIQNHAQWIKIPTNN